MVANFFEGPDGDRGAVDVTLDVPELGLDDIELTLPGTVEVLADSGFDVPEAWPVQAPARCQDSDGDGEATLDDAGIVFSWDPIAEEVELGGDGVELVGSYVHVSLSTLNLGWFGGESWALRASTVVPDSDGSVAIPNDVLYRFPSPNTVWAEYNNLSRRGTLGTFESNASYLLVEVHRITDYRIPLEDGGTLVFSYLTGDMTFPEWSHPLEGVDCRDCLDGDGDGWVDLEDPDCDVGAGGNGDTENNPTSEYSCNDGIDNDGDGWVDAEDAGCETSLDSEDDGFLGTECNDGVDNDGHGDTDRDDPYCFVEGPLTDDEEPSWSSGCIDGDDNDDDGYIDGFDPDCEYAPWNGERTDYHDPKALPATKQCYDGIDNDGDGATDAEDPSCWAAAFGGEPDGFIDDEAMDQGTDCTNDADDDGDGWYDGADPDCEPGDPTERGYGTTQCNDGIDNNKDGLIDSESPYCTDAEGNYEGP